MSSGGEHAPADEPAGDPVAGAEPERPEPEPEQPEPGRPEPGRPEPQRHESERPEPGRPEPEPREPPESRRWPFGALELFVAIMLGLAAVASAYSAWRNEQRNHEAAAHFSEGIRDYDNGGQFYGEGQSVLSRDQSLFLEYAKAKELGQTKLSNYIFLNLMSPTLQAGVRWWQGPNQKTSHPARNPFTPLDPDYRIQQLTDANTSYDASAKNFKEARAEQEKADHYTLVEVIVATALFLFGVAGVTRNPRSKIVTIAIATATFLVAIVLLITG